MKIFKNNLFKKPKIDFKFLPDFKEERTQKFTTIILTLAALSFFGLFAINPTLSTIAQLNKQLNDSNFVKQKLEQKINNLTTLQQKYVALQSVLPTILASIPKDPQVPIFAAQVQAVAGSSNVTIDNLQTFEVEVGQNTKQKQYSSFAFALTVEGSYNNLSNFLSGLSNMQRIVGIDILSLTKKTGGGTGLQLTLKGQTFFNP